MILVILFKSRSFGVDDLMLISKPRLTGFKKLLLAMWSPTRLISDLGR